MRLSLLLLLACSNAPVPHERPPGPPTGGAPPPPTAAKLDPLALKLFTSASAVTTPGGAAPSAALVDLGRTLFFDQRLSKNQDLSCNSCHALDQYGVDGKPTSSGHRGALGGRNAPTVYHAAAHVAQFWDGRAPDVEEQAKGPILNPIEMAMPDAAAVVAVLRTIPGYAPLFAAAFPGQKDPITYDNVGLAIGAFERGLVTTAPLDKLLAGDETAFTEEQKRGLNTFVEVGCTTCHNGALVGGGMYQKLGLVSVWPNANDQGRFEITKVESDKMIFKVPSLRNVAKTGPYFHDGGTTTLKEAVQLMGRHQLGRELNQDQLADIEAFLGALTGDLPTAYIQAPALPPSGPKTPAPDPS